MNIFLLAGEVSGDNLGGKLMAALKAQDSAVQMAGVGGPRMKEQGLDCLLDMEELNVMGIAEVVFQLPRLLKIMDGLAREIEARQPDILVTVDFPDFNFHLAKRLKKRGIFKGKIIHYVAPTVWAWRPDRAKKIAGFLDGLLCLYPFEPPYFEAHGLKTCFTGHPIVEEKPEATDPAAFRAAMGIGADTRTLGLLLGSREGEIKALSGRLIETAQYAAESVKGLALIVPTLPHLEYTVRDLLGDIGVPVHITTDVSDKWAAFKACDAAVAVSGTVGLELAYAGTPHIIGYRFKWLSYAIAKMMVKTKYAHLGNILLQERAVPEFIQMQCTSEKMSAAVIDLLEDEQKVAAQRLAFQKIRTRMHNPDRTNPSDKAAEFILSD